MPAAPAAPCATKKHRGRSHRYTGITRHSRTQWFTTYFVLSPAIGLFCHRRPQELPLANLTPASRRQAHTTSPSASAPFVIGASTSTASHPASVTIAIRPSVGETVRVLKLIWVRRKQKYFCKWDWTDRANQWAGIPIKRPLPGFRRIPSGIVPRFPP